MENFEKSNEAENVVFDIKMKAEEIEYDDLIEGRAIKGYKELIDMVSSRVKDFYDLGAIVEYNIGSLRKEGAKIEVVLNDGSRLPLLDVTFGTYSEEEHGNARGRLTEDYVHKQGETLNNIIDALLKIKK